METSGTTQVEANVFQALTENALDGILLTDAQGTITYANRAAHRLFQCNYEKREMLGSSRDSYWMERDLELLKQMVIPRALAKGWTGEMQNRRADGSPFDTILSAFPLRNPAGQILGLAFFIRDISERKRAESERQRLHEQVIEAQRHALQELSTPIIPVMERIIVMPLIGSIDSLRAKDITRTLLVGISRYRAKIVIVDITGVPLVDSGVADHLNKTIQAARLKGAQTIVTGMSDAVAEAIVDLGIDWSGIETLGDLQTGLLSALDSLGFKLGRK